MLNNCLGLDLGLYQCLGPKLRQTGSSLRVGLEIETQLITVSDLVSKIELGFADLVSALS